jgi:hypothetical protein
VPIIEVQKEYMRVPAEFSELHPNPAIPSKGDSLALLEWAQMCAVNNRKYENQATRLRGLSNE